MNTETITSEFLMRVFGLYPNAKITDGHFTYSITGLNFESNLVYGNIEGTEGVYPLSPELHKLILKPQSSISDEDAIELAETILGHPRKSRHWGKWFIENLNENSPYNTLKILKAFDYLRSKNYALPYMGIDLIEAGIAIYETDKTE